jgi:beta-ribofuranosylaminobenzene 5'-phosphate synthase
MFSFGHPGQPQFGGVGAMIDSPGLSISFSPADKFSVVGELAARVEGFIASALRAWGRAKSPDCLVEVRSPPDHIGLGVGTQLGLATAAGLRRFLELPEITANELAASVGRSGRSAVGTYGFQLGGLIVDAGRPGANSTENRLFDRLPLPPDWRFVLMQPCKARGLAGEREVEAFARLPAVPTDVTERLWHITKQQMIPAVKAAECPAFGEAVYQFGRLAGECFSAVQGGPFASAETARVVERIRDLGVAGVGQSSWGPTVFAITANAADANRIEQTLVDEVPGCSILISKPNNVGAVIRDEAVPC